MDELSDTLVYNKDFKHVFVIKSYDSGNTWTNPDSAFDIVRATQQESASDLEGAYSCMARHVDNRVHIIYERDYAPGISIARGGSCDSTANNTLLSGSSGTPNDIVYASVDTALVLGIHEFANQASGVKISANYPNPATESTQFKVTLNKAVNVKIDVEDILGQNLYSENKGKLGVGVHTVTLNTSYLSAGVYFYTVTAGDEKATGKMIVK